MNRESFPIPDPSSATTYLDESIPLGQRLLRAGLITHAQLAQALREQRQTSMRFGEVCLEHHWLTPQDFYQFTSAYSLGLGEILVARGLIGFDQLRITLAQQQRFARRIGEVLMWKGWITKEQLTDVLQEQRHIRKRSSLNAWQALQGVFLDQPQLLEPIDDDEWVEGTPNQATQNRPKSEMNLKIDPQPTASLPTSVNRDLESTTLGIPAHLRFSVEPPQISKTLPSSEGTVPPQYEHKIASLELQLELQQKEWDRQADEMNQQILIFQTQYQQRIGLLEGELRRSRQKLAEFGIDESEPSPYQAEIDALKAKLKVQQTEHRQLQQALADQYQAQIDNFETQLEQQRHRLTQTAETNSHYQQHLTRLQADLSESRSKHQAELEALAQDYLQQIDVLEDQLEGYQSLQQAFDQLQSKYDQLVIELTQAKTDVESLRDQLYS